MALSRIYGRQVCGSGSSIIFMGSRDNIARGTRGPNHMWISKYKPFNRAPKPNAVQARLDSSTTGLQMGTHLVTRGKEGSPGGEQLAENWRSVMRQGSQCLVCRGIPSHCTKSWQSGVHMGSQQIFPESGHHQAKNGPTVPPTPKKHLLRISPTPKKHLHCWLQAEVSNGFHQACFPPPQNLGSEGPTTTTQLTGRWTTTRSDCSLPTW